MGRVIRVTEQFQHFVEDLKETFWGDVYGKTKLLWKKFFEEESERLRDVEVGCDWHRPGSEPGREYRNGFYWRKFVTRLGTLRLKGHGPGRRVFCRRACSAFSGEPQEQPSFLREW